MEWRLEISNNKDYIKTQYLLKIKDKVMKCEYNVLDKICNELDIALKEFKSVHTRRISKYLR